MIEAKYENFTVPKEHYLVIPKDEESCYEYMLGCYERIKKDIGDFDAFCVPVADQESSVKMSDFIDEIERLAAYLHSAGFKRGDTFTVFLPSCSHAFTTLYALNKLGIKINYVHPLTPPQAFLESMALTKSKGVFMLDLAAAKYAPLIEKMGINTIVCSVSDHCDGIAYKYAVYNEQQNAVVPEMKTAVRYKAAVNNGLPKADTEKNFGKEVGFYLNGGGTTGKSKTVKLTSRHFNSLAYKLYLQDLPHDYKTAHAICVLPCFHAFGLGGSIHYAVCNAFKPFVMAKFDAHQANELIRKYNVIEILGVPKMFQKMLDCDNFENEGTKNLAMCFAGGDVVSENLLNRFDSIMEKHGASARLGRGYGLTEMCGVMTSNGAEHYKKESNGYPLAGLVIDILDENGKSLPDGEIGEIACSGDLIMEGYLPDGVINESGIYTDKNGVNWIKTGDMGYLDSEGYLYFCGRKKRIMIISGYNIYPATIEEKVEALDYISEVCAVEAKDRKTGKPIIKLCVSFTDKVTDKDAATNELKTFCENNIEAYACPREYVVLDALPRTKMDKIDFMTLAKEDIA